MYHQNTGARVSTECTIPHQLMLTLLLFVSPGWFLCITLWVERNWLSDGPFPSSWKLKAGIGYVSLQLLKNFSNSSTFDLISSFYQSSFDALIINTSAKFLDMFTNNKQKTKLSLELVRKWELFSAKKIVDKVSKLVLKYFHKYHLHFIQQRRIPAPSNREEATQSKRSHHITSSYKSEFS